MAEAPGVEPRSTGSEPAALPVELCPSVGSETPGNRTLPDGLRARCSALELTPRRSARNRTEISRVKAGSSAVELRTPVACSLRGARPSRTAPSETTSLQPAAATLPLIRPLKRQKPPRFPGRPPRFQRFHRPTFDPPGSGRQSRNTRRHTTTSLRYREAVI